MEPKTGKTNWFDLPVSDFEKAKAFYGELFGWKFKPMGSDYVMIEAEGDLIGGFRKPNGPISTSGDTPVIYFSVSKLDPAVERAKRMGGTLVGTRVELGGDNGAFHWVRDRDLNLFGLWAMN